jgi:hypothetical protein
VKRILPAALAFLVTVAYGADMRMKPGLWEVRVIKRVMDGQDQTPKAGTSPQMQQAMANLPPDQKAKIEAAMKQHAGSNGATRMCISPDMAKRDAPMLDHGGRCPPATVHRDGTHTTFEFSCTINGMTSTGKGDATVSGDVITTRVDTTMHALNGATHVTHDESEMHFVGPDCGDVKPPRPAH